MRKTLVPLTIAASVGVGFSQSPVAVNNSPAPINFDKTKDLFIAQFDSKPDPDDIHSIAAVGCMLAHPDLHNIDFYAVQGTVGVQGWAQRNSTGTNGPNNLFIAAPDLMNAAFGADRWTQAGSGLRNTFPNTPAYSDYNPKNTNWTASVTRVRDKAKAAIDRGGKVYVMEAGNSDFTRDWVGKLQDAGVSAASTRTNIIVVQHSNWNENQTTPTDRVGIGGNGSNPASKTQILNWVRANTDYRRIADGNGNNATPGYNTRQTQWAASAENNNNPNAHARLLWREAEEAILTVFRRGATPTTKREIESFSSIRDRGVDFSDTVEAWYIFNVGNNANTITKFWDRYVRNTNSTNGPRPRNFGGGGGGSTGDNGTPFGGSAKAIPGTIQAEDFNVGAQGVAYNDTSAGSFGGTSYRNTGVDIYEGNATDAARIIGSIADGEYLNYDVNVTTGTFNIIARVASNEANPGDLNVTIDGTSLGTFAIGNTGGWRNFQEVTISNVTLGVSGARNLRLTAVGGRFNIDLVRFETVSSGGGGNNGGGGSGNGTPFGGTAKAIPGTIQAEDFNVGAQGVAYNDTSAGSFGGTSYRNTGVDIYEGNATDAARIIGSIADGEYLNYDVNVTPGTFNIIARVASNEANPGDLRVDIDGGSLGTFAIGNTGGWRTFQEVTISNVTLGVGGARELRLTAVGGRFNIDLVRFETVSSGGGGNNSGGNNGGGDNGGGASGNGTPFGGTAKAIPGTIQAEDFNAGGQGVAYNDADTNNNGGSTYRSGEGVDIFDGNSTDSARAIGWISNGEFLNYDVNVTPGTFNIVARVASASSNPGDLKVEIDGADLGTLAIGNTGGWRSFQEVTLSNVTLGIGGARELKLTAVGGSFNIDLIRFDNASSGGGNEPAAFEEQNGLVIWEAESQPPASGWTAKTAVSGFKGSSYYEWTGPDRFNQPGTGVMTYRVKINTPGNYQFRWRNRILLPNSGGTEHNDSWVQFPSGENVTGQQALNKNWTKAYNNRTNAWVWDTSTVDNVGRPLIQFFSAGIHEVKVSGRSNGHGVDRMALSLVGTVTFNATTFDNAPQSPTTGGSGTPQTVNINPAADVYIENSTKLDNNVLRVESSGRTRTSYIRFNVSGLSGSTTAAKLRLVVPAAADGGDGGTGTIQVYKGTSNPTWTEASITAGNVPAQGALLGSKNGSFGLNTTHEIDLTASEIPASGNVTLIVKINNTQDVAFSSSEGSSTPQLSVTAQ